MAYTLRPNSIPNEFYCGNLPGTLQYRLDAESLIRMDTSGTMTETDLVWTRETCTDAMKGALLPRTQKPANWDLVMAMKRNIGQGVVIKGVLVNRATRKIALMTTFDNKDTIISRGNRPIQSNREGWFVGHYRMGAPIVFWRSLQTVLSQ